MKKVFAFLLVVMFMVGSLLHASYTENNSTLLSPILLENDIITQTYPQKLVNFTNLAVYERTATSSWGYLNLDIGAGILGISGGPVPNISNLTVTNFGQTLPSNIIGVMYSTKLDSLDIGANVVYGMDKDYEVEKKDGGTDDKDVLTDLMESYAKIVLGASLKGDLALDLGLSVALPGYSSNPKNYNAAGNLTDDNYTKLGGLLLGVNVGTKLSEIILDLGIEFGSLKAERQTWTDVDGNGTPEVNILQTSEDSNIALNLLAGKKTKVTETFEVIIGSGLSVNLASPTKDVTENKISGTKTYNTNRDSSTTITIPLNLAVLCKINETWSWMAGLSKNFLIMTNTNYKTVSATDETVTDESNRSQFDIDETLSTAMGITGTFGDVKIQGTINSSILTNGPYFISGAITPNLISMLALVYDWK
ncbi:MAG: hypothetical protein N3E50_09445 [Candidatus Goldbacteria bacterium]|nr:hypothetical protein [Candidatus Goldiibacteriota bacterium]